MKIQIVRSDRTVTVDDQNRIVDLSGIDQTIHALIFDTVKGIGRIWYQDEKGDASQADLFDFSKFQVFLDRWTAAAPPPPPPPLPPVDLSDMDNLEKVVKALALCVAQIGGLTALQMKLLFKQKYDGLP